MITGNHTITTSLYYVSPEKSYKNYTADDFFCLSQNQQLFCNAFYKKVCRLFNYRNYAANFHAGFPEINLMSLSDAES